MVRLIINKINSSLLILGMGTFLIISMNIKSEASFTRFNKNAHKNVNGAPVAKTGAPGESSLSCTQCHAGSVNNGSAQNILEVSDGVSTITDYIPGQTYTVSLSLATGNVKEGFQATVLDIATNTMAGSFPGTGLVGSKIVSSAGRDYATHISSSTNEGNVSWDWDWNAPATDVGPVKFYVASNKANGNGATNGDQIFLSQHSFNSTVGLNEYAEFDLKFNVYFDKNSNNLKLTFNALTKENVFVKMTGMEGNYILSKQLGLSDVGGNKQTIEVGKEIKSGVYIVQLFVGNKGISKKLQI